MRLAPWRMIVGSRVPSASMRLRTTSVAIVHRAVDRLRRARPRSASARSGCRSTTAMSQSRWPVSAGAAGQRLRARSRAASTWRGSRDHEATAGRPRSRCRRSRCAARRGASRCGPAPPSSSSRCLRDVAGVGLEQEMAAAGKVEAEVDPRRAGSQPARLGTLLRAGSWGSRAATQSARSAPIDQTFQRGKSSMARSVVRGLGGAGGGHVGERRLDAP